MVARNVRGMDLTVRRGLVVLVGALAAGLALAGCGRKGPLEAPPSANSMSAAPELSGPSLGEADHPGFRREQQAEAAPPSTPAPQQPAAPNKPFFLDFLIAK